MCWCDVNIVMRLFNGGFVEMLEVYEFFVYLIKYD